MNELSPAHEEARRAPNKRLYRGENTATRDARRLLHRDVVKQNRLLASLSWHWSCCRRTRAIRAGRAVARARASWRDTSPARCTLSRSARRPREAPRRRDAPCRAGHVARATAPRRHDALLLSDQADQAHDSRSARAPSSRVDVPKAPPAQMTGSVGDSEPSNRRTRVRRARVTRFGTRTRQPLLRAASSVSPRFSIFGRVCSRAGAPTPRCVRRGRISLSLS